MKRREFSSAVVGIASALPSPAQRWSHLRAAHGQPGAPVEGSDFAKIVPCRSPPATSRSSVHDFLLSARLHRNAFRPGARREGAAAPGGRDRAARPGALSVNAENFQRTYCALGGDGTGRRDAPQGFAAVRRPHAFDKPVDVAAFMSKTASMAPSSSRCSIPLGGARRSSRAGCQARRRVRARHPGQVPAEHGWAPDRALAVSGLPDSAVKSGRAS